jgi:undecaprenyl-diphosphatase
VKPLPLIAAGLLLAGLIAGQQRVSRRMRLLGGAAALGLAAVGTGVVHPPNLEDLARDIGSMLGPYTYALVGAMAFLETGAGVGLVAPGELVVILGGVAAGQGEVELAPLIALAWVCAVAGDTVSFFLGRRLGRGFLIERGDRFGLSGDRLERIERHFARHGGETILLGRFIGLVRSLAPFVAGASRMPARRFLPMTALAAAIWATACTLLGYVFWNSVDEALALAKESSLALAAVVLAGFAVRLAARRLTRFRARRRSARLALDRAHRS